MVDKVVSMYFELVRDIRVTSWNWDAGYGGYASGRGIVFNNSSYSIPKLKYKVTFKDELGNAVTSDEGYVTYDELAAGESKSFTFYTGYVAGSSRASIELLFDEELIFRYLAAKDWTGNECEDYYKNHVDTTRD